MNLAGLSWNPVKRITSGTIQETAGVSWEGFLVGCLCQLMCVPPSLKSRRTFVRGATVEWEKPLCKNKGGLCQPR